MQIYLAGENGKKKILCNYFLPEQCSAIKAMQFRSSGGYYDNAVLKYKPYILESFYYADEVTEKLLPYFGDFLLDSGAFTFMQGKKNNNLDWNDYVDKYSDFINRNKVDKFFELDIDSIVGYENVIKLRNRLESKTGKQCIPVWHKSRGKKEYIEMCKNYNYVALGGIAINAKGKDEFRHKYFPWFIDVAHEHGAKIHCLGFTRLKEIERYHFDSVDSTSWTAGNRFGFLYKFDGRTMQKIEKKGHRISKPQAAALHNFIEWIKFQQYADKYL